MSRRQEKAHLWWPSYEMRGAGETLLGVRLMVDFSRPGLRRDPLKMLGVTLAVRSSFVLADGRAL